MLLMACFSVKISTINNSVNSQNFLMNFAELLPIYLALSPANYAYIG